MSDTKIQWTDATWNPVRGCSMAPGSELGGCLNCYAARQAARGLPAMASPTTGEPFAVMRDSGPRWTGKVELIESKLEDPLHWKRPRRVFVNSMSDLFHEALPDWAIDQIFAVMRQCPQHTFQVLSKRPARMLEHRQCCGIRPVLPNVWLGVSVEDRRNRDRIDLLREIPAAVRFVSLEPLLEDPGTLDLRGIAWVIVGGESGPGARPFDIAAARAVIAQCKAAGVACFFKQAGANPILSVTDLHRWLAEFPDTDRVLVDNHYRLRLRDRKGGDPAEWAADLRVREFPQPPAPSPQPQEYSDAQGRRPVQRP